jgi:hypothetical protein
MKVINLPGVTITVITGNEPPTIAPSQLSRHLSRLNRNWDTPPRSHRNDDPRKPHRPFLRSIP